MKRLRKLLKSSKRVLKNRTRSCSLEELAASLEPQAPCNYENIDWENQHPGWTLISKPAGPYWFMIDPIYAKVSERLKKKLGLEKISEKDIQFFVSTAERVENDQVYLLQSGDKLELVRMNFTMGGLDGSGRFYYFDLPNYDKERT